MRKAWILLTVAAVTASSAGCCGSLRNLFHKGAPCGARMAPAALGAPVAMTGPPVGMPCYEPCEEMCDPCQTWTSSGYFGGDCGCQGMTVAPSAPTSIGEYVPAAPLPSPAAGGTYRDPGPTRE